MGKSTVFNGQFIKTLKANLNLSDDAYILTGTDNPTAIPKNAPKGSLYLRQTSSGDGEVYVKNDNGNTTNWQNLNKIKIAVQDLVPGAINQPITNLTVPATKAYDINYLAERQLSPFNSSATAEMSGFKRIGNTVMALAVQPDGKILMSTFLANYGFIPGRNHFFRFNSDGTLDTAFVNNATDGGKFNYEVRAIAIQPDGKILAGGIFSDYAGTAGRNYLIRLNPDGTLDTSFVANATDGGKFGWTPLSMVVQPDGKILVGGSFAHYAGISGRSFLIRLNSDGTLDTAFVANATDGGKFNSEVRTVAIQSDGKILIGGSFSDYAGTSGRNYLIRLNSDGTLDTSFVANATDGNKFNFLVRSIAIQPDGKILVGGDFTNYAGTAGRNRLIRLNSDGTLDTSFVNNATDGSKFNNTVYSVKTAQDGLIFVAGSFTNYAGTAARNKLVCILNDGSVNSSITSGMSDGGRFSGDVTLIEVNNNDLFASGNFIYYPTEEGIQLHPLVRFNIYGGTGNHFTAVASDGQKFGGLGNLIAAVAVQTDNKALVGGFFNDYAGIPGRSHLVRLNSDGTLDTSFVANAVDGGKFSGTVRSIAVQSDGKTLIGGVFVDYAGTSGRSRLIRLNSDGTLDTAFVANATDGNKFNDTIHSITVQSDGKILVGGNFTNYAGTSGRSHLVRLNSDGTLDTSFVANATDGGKFNNETRALAVQPDDKILIGGAFTNYAGTSGRSHLVRLNSDGTLDTSFVTNATDGSKFSNTVYSVAIQSDGKILIGGAFTNYAGTSGRNRLIRLNSDGTLDTAFVANASDGSKFSFIVNSVAITQDGSLLVGGAFTNYAGTSGRSHLVRLNSDGTLDTSFVANSADGGKFNSSVTSIVIRTDGRILLGGEFANYTNITGRNYLIQLKINGSLDYSTSFYLNYSLNSLLALYRKINNEMNTYAQFSDGKFLVGGSFTSYGGFQRLSYLVKFNANNTIDHEFADNIRGHIQSTVHSIAIQSNNKVLVGGNFINYASTTGRDYLVRLNSNGTLDTAFMANAVDGGKFNNTVRSVAVQPDGKALIGGHFTSYAGTSGRNRLIRLNSDGTLDTAFVANATDGSKFSNTVRYIAVQDDGKILVGGAFTNYAGTSGRSYLVRLNSDGTLDTAFTANAVDGNKFNNEISSITIQSDGKILVGGNFTNYAGVSGRDRLIRLNSDGTLDTSFVANATDGNKFNSIVRSITVQSNGQILVGGYFTNYAGTAGRSYLVRLNSDGTLDTFFAANTADGNKFNSGIHFTGIHSDGKILVGGYFIDYAGYQHVNYLIILRNPELLLEMGSMSAFNLGDGDCFISEQSYDGLSAGLNFDIDSSGAVRYNASDTDSIYFKLNWFSFNK